MNPTAPTTPPDNTLIYLLQHLDGGAVLTEASAKMREVAEAVRRLSAKGELTIKFVLKPLNGSAHTFEPTITAKVPQHSPARSIFFINEDGSISRDDKRQSTFNFSTMPGGGALEPPADTTTSQAAS